MQGLDKFVSEEYNLDVKSVIPYRNSYIISCATGNKLLKKSTVPAERLLFIHAAKEHLYNKGFTNIDRYLCNISGRPYAYMDGAAYTLTEMIEGRECDFNNREDVIKASRLLASMHKASKGFRAPEGCDICDYLGKLPFYYQKRLNEIKKLLKTARMVKSKFDYLFVKHADEFCRQGEEALRLLASSKYEEVVNMYRKESGLCHHDFTYNNIICNNIICGKSDIFITNFEYCCFELKVYDLANFIRRKMRKCNWDVNEAMVILDEYCSVENISKDEFQIMKIMLRFPQKFWRVVNKYYNSNRSWTEKNYIYRLQEVIDEIPYSARFFDYLDRIY